MRQALLGRKIYDEAMSDEHPLLYALSFSVHNIPSHFYDLILA